jgi:hypothetical protein
MYTHEHFENYLVSWALCQKFHIVCQSSIMFLSLRFCTTSGKKLLLLSRLHYSFVMVSFCCPSHICVLSFNSFDVFTIFFARLSGVHVLFSNWYLFINFDGTIPEWKWLKLHFSCFYIQTNLAQNHFIVRMTCKYMGVCFFATIEGVITIEADWHLNQYNKHI